MFSNTSMTAAGVVLIAPVGQRQAKFQIIFSFLLTFLCSGFVPHTIASYDIITLSTLSIESFSCLNQFFHTHIVTLSMIF